MATATRPRRLRTRARIGAEVIWDHQVRPVACDPADVPWRADAISTSWLTHALCREVPDARVESFVVAGGDDGSSIRRRVSVAYNEAGQRAGLPRHLFTKSTPTLLTRLLSGFAAPSESFFFTDIRPDLPIEAPVHRHSAVDPQTMRSIHLFDDLVQTRGAEFCNQTTSIDRGQAEQVIDTLAELHGRFHGRDGVLDALPFATFADFVRTNERNGFRDGHDRAMIEAADVIPDAVLDRQDEIWPQLLGSLGWHEVETRTLLHSDVHLGNWYVTADGRMGLGDWATVCTGHWARDVAYAVSTILAPDDRRAWERGLLDRYAAAMRDRCRFEVTDEQLWDRYRVHTFAALFMWTPTLCHPPTTPDMQPEEMSREMIRRITIAIDDLDALDAPIPG